MSTQLTQFNPGQMPDSISRLFGDNGAASDLTSGAESAFPILSIKGRIFCVKQGGEKRVIQHGGQPVFALDVVLLKANPNLSKLYYAKAYSEGDDNPPDCSASNGVVPDAGVPDQQSPTCATCPQNAWGSKITPQGAKTKACADTRRLALIPERDLECKTWGAPLLLRVPAASLQPLAEYGRTVLGGKPYSAVVTRISFDLDVAYPKLTFTPVRWLEAVEVQQVMRWMGDPITKRIIGIDVDPSAPNVQVTAMPSTLGPAVTVQVQSPPPELVAARAAPVDPLAGLPEYLRIAIVAAGGPESPGGKAMLALPRGDVALSDPITGVSANPPVGTVMNPPPAKTRTRRTKAELAAAGQPPPKQDALPAIELGGPAVPGYAGQRPTDVPGGAVELGGPAVAPAPAGNGALLQGVDDLLAGLNDLSFDE